ncbi:15370_t:CDS:2 [Cetraspora pellucida]|uniref:Vacuolar calcium ion transporter n=1 Tax=Cetraspora pellucida TaxID=1433469 RepID=A0A9N9FN22_9GLOM|nr:15370_t:CDS:2 [Cetraspora pellucida]
MSLHAQEREKLSLLKTLQKIFFNSYVNVLLLFVPIGFIVHFVSQNDTLIFFMNFLAIIPLAKLLGFATEELACTVGETVGGLLNATFGNAVELIIAIVALVKGQIRVVQASMLGSVLSNILLVLGTCFLLGGISVIYYDRGLEQNFSSTAAQASSSLMTLACITLVLPAAFSLAVNGTSNGTANVSNTENSTLKVDDRILHISYGTSIVLLAVYILYLLFQLKTHKKLFVVTENDAEQLKSSRDVKPDLEKKSADNKPENSESETHENVENADNVGNADNADDGNQNDKGKGSEIMIEESEEIHISTAVALILLLVTTVITAFSAEFLVGSIEGIVKSLGISETFIGLILLPIVGNAAEHVTSVTVAMNDKMDLAIGVAVGSSTVTNRIIYYSTPGDFGMDHSSADVFILFTI